ncbi:MFS transporter [Paeniglutamicibacter cryotolerans]|uniref:MFS family permease n=1 Tax=Paeniglutamicibacter cryotolerans TaxID=670079 RepID=A0A839QI26_9MICC|nr:MFS transporter [Paeniglutamicibacter cryotolerans]MBB2994394.1 MFS family permease [Paeniglutamicibacter cryotolerans]
MTQYFQLGAGVSPTRAGLMTIPMILGQLLSSTIGGQLVNRMGRWKPVMMVGSVLMFMGLAGLGAIDHATPYWFVAIFMTLMGVGIGTLVQNVVLAVQNTVDVTDIGAASAAIAFFRSLAGAIGVAVLGGILTGRVGTNIADGLGALGIKPGALSGGSGETQLDVSGLPEAVQQVFHQAYADAFGPVFLVASMIAVVSVVTIAVVRGTPLRSTVSMSPALATEAPARAESGPAA